MSYRMVNLSVRNRAAAVALGAAVLVVGALLFALGLTLLLGIATIGVATGIAVAIYRRFTRGSRRARAARAVRGLDPSMEVFPSAPSGSQLHSRGNP